MNDERRHNRENGARGDLPVDALLSAYVDDRASLSAAELERVEALLASDAAARRAHAELQVVIGELRRLEPVSAPRSYHLDARMVGAPEPVRMTASNAWYARHAGALRWATAAAAVLFVFVLSADLVLNGIFSDPSSNSENVSSLPGNQAEMSGADGAADESAPPVEDDASGGAAEDAASGEQALEEPEADDPETLAIPSDATAAEEAAGEAEEEAVEEAGEETAGAEESDGSDSPPPEAIPTAEIAIAGDESGDGEAEADDDADRDDAAEDTARVTGATATAGDQAAAPETLAYDESAANTDDGDSRRLWRIAEFSLVVILALLLTAMIILPRMARAPTRRS